MRFVSLQPFPRLEPTPTSSNFDAANSWKPIRHKERFLLERTLKLIEGISPGTYVDPENLVFDEAEISELGRVLNRLLYAPSQLRSRLQACGVNIVPANFYSEVPGVEEVEDVGAQSPFFDRIFDDAEILATLERLDRYADEFSPPVASEDYSGFAWNNSAFSYSDAMSYYCMIRDRKPKKILEVGCGWSSLVAAQAIQRNGSGSLVCVDPFPSPVLKHIIGVMELIERPAQDLPTDFISSHLDDGDILFIDSTHTVKHNSDCIHLYLRLLPEVHSSIMVHAHDIRLPQPLSIEMMRDSQIYWTEQYLLYAYLLGNSRCRTVYGSTYLYDRHRDKLQTFMRGKYPAGGASLWFEQRSA